MIQCTFRKNEYLLGSLYIYSIHLRLYINKLITNSTNHCIEIEKIVINFTKIVKLHRNR